MRRKGKKHDVHKISSTHSHGPSLALNSRGGREPSLLNLGHDIVGEVALLERLNRLGHVRSKDGDLLLAAEFRDFSLSAGSDGFVLGVEVLFEVREGGHVPFDLAKVVSELTH